MLIGCKLLGRLLGTCHIGAKTGRSPRDKRVVRETESENDIWWNQDKNGSPNFEMDERSVIMPHGYMMALTLFVLATHMHCCYLSQLSACQMYNICT